MNQLYSGAEPGSAIPEPLLYSDLPVQITQAYIDELVRLNPARTDLSYLTEWPGMVAVELEAAKHGGDAFHYNGVLINGIDQIPAYTRNVVATSRVAVAGEGSDDTDILSAKMARGYIGAAREARRIWYDMPGLVVASHISFEALGFAPGDDVRALRDQTRAVLDIAVEGGNRTIRLVPDELARNIGATTIHRVHAKNGVGMTQWRPESERQQDYASNGDSSRTVTDADREQVDAMVARLESDSLSPEATAEHLARTLRNLNIIVREQGGK